MAKSLRTEQIADLFLVNLAKPKGVEKDDLLDEFLVTRNIYYDFKSLQAVLNLLLEEKLVEVIPGVSSSLTYVPYNKQVAAVEGQIMPVSAYLANTEGIIPGCEITGKGRHFVDEGQKLDIQGIIEKKENRKKWTERLINFLIALITAIGVVLLTEPIKKIINSKPQIEHSPVRPRPAHRRV